MKSSHLPSAEAFFELLTYTGKWGPVFPFYFMVSYCLFYFIACCHSQFLSPSCVKGRWWGEQLRQIEGGKGIIIIHDIFFQNLLHEILGKPLPLIFHFF